MPYRMWLSLTTTNQALLQHPGSDQALNDARYGGTARRSSTTVVSGPASHSAGVTPPAYPIERIPAARAASTPYRLSLTTTQAAASAASARAACKNRSGAGLPA